MHKQITQDKLKNSKCSCEQLLKQISTLKIEEKIEVLTQIEKVHAFLAENQVFHDFLQSQPQEIFYVTLCLIAIDQESILINLSKLTNDLEEKFSQLAKTLLEIENFYNSIGGIIGYHEKILFLMLQTKEAKDRPTDQENYFIPPYIDIQTLDSATQKAVIAGIKHLPTFGDLYPVGGAGDRLKLSDTRTGTPLPAGLLPFLGRDLLTGLIRDVEGREFLYYRLYHHSFCTPIALMTSQEKNNRAYIEKICENSHWYGRGKENFKFFDQPLVPIISENGEWVMLDAHHFMLKPGGHGVIWKQAQDKKIFDWFAEKKCTRLLIRQVNNPIAGTDYGILATLGLSILENKVYGSLGCGRLLNSAEGTNVLCERHKEEHYEYGITNIEYTEFENKGIKDTPIEERGKYSSFPANTNILCVELDGIKKALNILPIPGLILNLKTKFKHYRNNHLYEEHLGGRLESSMQNIADAFFQIHEKKINDPSQLSLKTFLTYYSRNKTISVTKNSHEKEDKFFETPLGAHYEILNNYHSLLKDHCHIDLPNFSTREEYDTRGPNLIADFHPALGPLWEIISQKIRKGRFHPGAELILEIADVSIENLDLSGSLIIEAKSILGKRNDHGEIIDGSYTGKCTLKNIKVSNRGIDKESHNIYWSNTIQRKESLEIILHGNAEFYASDMTIHGSHRIEVFEGTKVTASMKNDQLLLLKESIDKPSWNWQYQLKEDQDIFLYRSQQ